jgi:hypothetical protein
VIMKDAWLVSPEEVATCRSSEGAPVGGRCGTIPAYPVEVDHLANHTGTLFYGVLPDPVAGIPDGTEEVHETQRGPSRGGTSTLVSDSPRDQKRRADWERTEVG